MTHRRAANPESASTIEKPSGDKAALKANRFVALSSTTKIDTSEGVVRL
jgi:hypothetical protein